MSNTISYDKNKLQTFIDAYNDMNSIMTSYNDKINNFQEAVQLLTDGFSSDTREPDEQIQQYHFFQNSSSSLYYMMTHENILIKLQNRPNDETDRAKIPIFELSNESETILNEENLNTVVEISGTYNTTDLISHWGRYNTENNQFGSKLLVEDGTNSILTVRAVYVGNVGNDNDKFQNDDTNNYWHVTNMMRYRNNNVQPNYWGMGGLMNAPLTRNHLKKGVHKMTGDVLIRDIESGTSSGECDNEFYQKCIMESIDKRTGTNVPMIGLHQDQSANCMCYDMTGQPANIGKSINYYEEEVYTSTNSDSMHYFGLFMDGRVMGLKAETYYNNFNNFFNVVPDNLVTSGIPNTYMNSLSTVLNPFVGHGMHAFNISSINDRRPPS